MDDFERILQLNPSFSQAHYQRAKILAKEGEFEKADKELNQVYGNILKEYKKDTVFIKSLKKSQKLWIQLRDAEMKVKFPDRERGYYGSVLPMCWSLYKTELTIRRANELKVWINGVEEGDVCAGTVKIKAH